MSTAVKKITINLPAKTLERARKITGKGITETILQALEELERKQKMEMLRQLKGKISFDLDLEKTRQ